MQGQEGSVVIRPCCWRPHYHAVITGGARARRARGSAANRRAGSRQVAAWPSMSRQIAAWPSMRMGCHHLLHHLPLPCLRPCHRIMPVMIVWMLRRRRRRAFLNTR